MIAKNGSKSSRSKIEKSRCKDNYIAYFSEPRKNHRIIKSEIFDEQQKLHLYYDTFPFVERFCVKSNDVPI